MKEQIYIFRDVEIEQSSDFAIISRNDKTAMRVFKQWAKNAPDPDALIVLQIGSYDRDTDQGIFTTPRQVFEIAPGTQLTEDEIKLREGIE